MALSGQKNFHPVPDSHRVFAVDLARFQEEVLEASRQRRVLVDFWAAWCSPCLAIAPHLERAVRENPQPLWLAKLEVDEGENMRLAGHYRVRGFPTLILFSGGEEQKRCSGSRSFHGIRDWLSSP
ncbi:MAG: thioredoxin family protein [Pseudomonadota bacterium]